MGCSIEVMGTSGVANSGEEGIATEGVLLGSLSDAELAGRDFGEDSPEVGSRPKKVHFLADFGVVGIGAASVVDATSMSKGMEFLLLGAGMSGIRIASRSNVGSAVRGRASVPLWFDTGDCKPRCSLDGGLEAPVEIRLESDPETEWPCLPVIVLELSLDTNERGRGMI